ncbi:MAG: hypothetical protein R6X27_02395 [Candidatus Desulfacyla sp.]
MIHAIKGIYQAGSVRLVEKAPVEQPSEVLVIFPAKARRVVKIGGLFKGSEIDEKEIERELSELDRRSTGHLEAEAREDPGLVPQGFLSQLVHQLP